MPWIYYLFTHCMYQKAKFQLETLKELVEVLWVLLKLNEKSSSLAQNNMCVLPSSTQGQQCFWFLLKYVLDTVGTAQVRGSYKRTTCWFLLESQQRKENTNVMPSSCILSYCDLCQNLLGTEHSKTVYHSLLLEALWDCGACPRLRRLVLLSEELNSQPLAFLPGA